MTPIADPPLPPYDARTCHACNTSFVRIYGQPSNCPNCHINYPEQSSLAHITGFSVGIYVYCPLCRRVTRDLPHAVCSRCGLPDGRLEPLPVHLWPS